MNNYHQHESSDQQLVHQALSGNPQAFGQIVRQTERLVAGIVFKMIPDAEQRRDLAQDSYLKAWHRLHQFRFQSKLSTWIAQIAYNTCTDYLRKQKGLLLVALEAEKESTPVYETMADTLLDQKEMAGILQQEIDKLSPVFQTLITLYHQQELSYEEIGTITGLPPGTVKSYLFRARKALRNSLLAQYDKNEL